MKMHLDLSDASAFVEPYRDYDMENGSIIDIVGDICDALHEVGARGFTVSGFGDDPWHLYYGVDLMIALLELPAALSALKDKRSFDFDFFEQTQERYIHFELRHDAYVLTCTSHHRTWVPNPATEIMPFTDVETMMRTLHTTFATFVRERAPRLAVHPWMQEWLAA